MAYLYRTTIMNLHRTRGPIKLQPRDTEKGTLVLMDLVRRTLVHMVLVEITKARLVFQGTLIIFFIIFNFSF